MSIVKKAPPRPKRPSKPKRPAKFNPSKFNKARNSYFGISKQSVYGQVKPVNPSKMPKGTVFGKGVGP